MDREEIIDKFSSYYHVITDSQIGLVFREEIGSYSLIKHKKQITEIIESLQFIYENFNIFGNDFLLKAVTLAKTVHETLQTIRLLSDSEYTASFKQNNTKLIDLYYSFLDIRQAIRLQQSEKSSSSDILKIIGDLNKIKTQVEETKKLKENLDDLDKRYSEMIPNLEIINQREIFKKEAGRNKDESKWWLFGIVISLILLIILICVIFQNFCFEASCFNTTELAKYNTICNDCGEQVLWLEILKALLFRLLLISIALYILSFTVKNYNNAKHNLTINRHKQNSFEAAIVLIDHTDNGKDEIISKAAQAIFAQQKTGYIAKENDNINAGLIEQIINLKK